MIDNQKIFEVFINSLQAVHEAKSSNYNPAYYSVLNLYSAQDYNSTILCPIQSGPAKDWAEQAAVLVNEALRFTNIVSLPAVFILGGSLDGSSARNLDFAYHFFTNLHPDIFSLPFSCTLKIFTSAGESLCLSIQELAQTFEIDEINGLRLISPEDFAKFAVSKLKSLASPESISLKPVLDLRIIELE
ncbi:MAG: hypothetical protein SFU25_01805 [Candidatus Caenarcaniphilales bacterium]|nr:hypothetical protein [Candidatus Caenarcaniphilales bacterium]